MVDFYGQALLSTNKVPKFGRHVALSGTAEGAVARLLSAGETE